MHSELLAAPRLHFHLQSHCPLHFAANSRRHAALYVLGRCGSHGMCHVQWEDTAPVPLRAGDTVLLPHAGQHRVYDAATSRVQRIGPLLRQATAQRQGRGVSLVLPPACSGSPHFPSPLPLLLCGGFYSRVALAAVDLPPVLVLRSAQAPAWLPHMARLIAWMTDLRHGGGQGVGAAPLMNALLLNLLAQRLGDPSVNPAAKTR